jgi:hypothetical protein
MRIANVLALVLAVTFGVHGALMVLAVHVMRAGAASVGFSVMQYRYIGLLEVAAAIGLVAGVAVPALGIAAGAGLVMLMAGALIVHYRAGDPLPRMVPAIVLRSIAIAYIALAVALA